MDIIVQGVGKKYYSPEEVEINLNFYTNANSYEKALEDGTENVELFIRNVMKEMQFDKDKLKTQNFKVYEETKYDYENKKQISLGYAYIQSATLKFDYNINTVAEFMDRTSKLENSPKYFLTFNIKDLKQCKEEALAEAFNSAKEKAEAIAKAAGKELNECLKTDFRPFEERLVSNSELNSIDMLNEDKLGAVYKNLRSKKVQDTVQTIFTPEDVLISETLYCLWTTN